VAGDVITSIDGQSATTGSALQTILLTKKPGDTIHLDYLNLSASPNQSASYWNWSGA